MTYVFFHELNSFDMSLIVSKSPLKLCTNAHNLYPLYTNIIITRGKSFLQKLILSKDGPVKSTKNKAGMKENTQKLPYGTLAEQKVEDYLHTCNGSLSCSCPFYKSISTWKEVGKNFFTPVSVAFRRRVKAQKLTMNKTVIILCPLKLSDSSVQIIITTLLLLNYPFSAKSIVSYQNNVLHLILPCLLDLDTVCVVCGLQNINTYITSDLCFAFKLFSLLITLVGRN